MMNIDVVVLIITTTHFLRFVQRNRDHKISELGKITTWLAAGILVHPFNSFIYSKAVSFVRNDITSIFSLQSIIHIYQNSFYVRSLDAGILMLVSLYYTDRASEFLYHRFTHHHHHHKIDQQARQQQQLEHTSSTSHLNPRFYRYRDQHLVQLLEEEEEEQHPEEKKKKITELKNLYVVRLNHWLARSLISISTHWFANILYYPIETCFMRLNCSGMDPQHQTYPAPLTQCIPYIWQNEGFPSFYHGLSAHLVSIGPTALFSVMIYFTGRVVINFVPPKYLAMALGLAPVAVLPPPGQESDEVSDEE